MRVALARAALRLHAEDGLARAANQLERWGQRARANA
jgi:hypothetical protein